jgi:hypothetical protein
MKMGVGVLLFRAHLFPQVSKEFVQFNRPPQDITDEHLWISVYFINDKKREGWIVNMRVNNARNKCGDSFLQRRVAV